MSFRDRLDTVMQRTGNLNAAGLRRICRDKALEATKGGGGGGGLGDGKY